MQNSPFTFEFSLMVLNHLGRNLYRSFVTVLGEAISNSWDADAKNVWIEIDRENNRFVIKDDGDGMDSDEFQNKFLKIGYSKRKGNSSKSMSGRPYIGRKGIGKLALLSCAEKIFILSKRKGGEYVGSVIDNSELDEAIKEDLSTAKLKLNIPEIEHFNQYTRDHPKGTIICFESVRDGIYNKIEHITKIVALNFRFTLIDPSFSIHINGDEITPEELSDLRDDTQFLWITDNFSDPFVSCLSSEVSAVEKLDFGMLDFSVRGFIASVKKPSMLKIRGMDENVSVDLFVNGRLRQKDILAPVSWNRIAENYLYGQIHIDDMDGGSSSDRFTSNREGVVPDDAMFKEFLTLFKQKLLSIYTQWDKLRLDKDQDGDPEDKRITKQERKAREFTNAVAEDYKNLLQNWTKDKLDELKASSGRNSSTYLHCFLAENILREYIRENNLGFHRGAKDNSRKNRTSESQNKTKASLSIGIRNPGDDLDYLDFKDLSRICEGTGAPKNHLSDSGIKYKPIRDAVMHTAFLTDDAYRMLEAMYSNIQARIQELVVNSDDTDNS